jgi:hypothetical protein
MADFPSSITSLTNPTNTDPMNNPSHADQHGNANDEIEAIETELGVNPAGSSATVVARLDTNDTAVGLNTTHRSSNGTDHANVVTNTTNIATNTSNIATHATTLSTLDGYVDQDVGTGSSPILDGANITGVDAANVDIADAGEIITGTDVEAALAENRGLINTNVSNIAAHATTLTYVDQDVTSGSGPSFTSAQLTTPVLGTPSSGNLTSCTGYEGTAVKSTGEGGGTKYLREDGDGTCSWQTVSAGVSDLQGAFDGGQSITIADTDNQTLDINNNDTTNNPDTITIDNATTGDAIDITCSGNGPHLNLNGDPTVASATDGDLWYTGSELNFYDGSTTTDLLSSTLSDASVTTAKLKTTDQSVSTTSTGGDRLTLPGGEYGFYPRVRGSVADKVVRVGYWGLGGDTSGITTTDTAYIELFITTGGGTGYADQRYVTASGEDYWIFALVEKDTGFIRSMYTAPDHPAYGNGGNFELLDNPFPGYNKDKYEVCICSQSDIKQLEKEASSAGKKKIDLFDNALKFNLTHKENYVPLHSGKYLKQDKDGEQVQVRELVTYFPHTVRRIEALSAQDRSIIKARNEKELEEQLKKDRVEKLVRERLEEIAIKSLKDDGIL